MDRSNASSVSGGFGVAASQDSVAFEDIFARMFGGAEGAAGGLDPSMLTGAANQLFSGGTSFMQGIGQDAGSQYMEGRLSGENPVLQEQIDLLGADLGKFFGEELNPQITSQAVAGGSLGGSRQGVAQGRGLDMVGEQFARGATALRAGDIGARDAVAGTLGQQGIQGAQVGLGGLGSMAGIADMGFGAGMAPYERLAAILGGPTTLNTSASTSADFARSLSSSYGYSNASSTSKSKGFNFGYSPGG
jgi:hypothetical protein